MESIKDAIHEWINKEEDVILKDIMDNYSHATQLEKYHMALGVTALAGMLDGRLHGHKLKEFEG